MRDVCLAGALCLALGAGSAAAGDDPPVALPPVVVPLPPDAPRPEAPERKDPSGSITVVEAAPRRGEARDTAELVATVPGVQVSDLGGLGQSKSLSVRGASSTGVLVMVDGVPLNGAGGIADLSQVPLALVDRLEVVRGGAGARYGSGGLGGVVNIVTPEPSDGLRASAGATYGSFGTALGELAATGPLGGGQGLLLLHGGRTRGDFMFPFDEQPNVADNPLLDVARENNDAAWGGALFKYRRALGRRWTADAMGEVSALSRGIAGTARNPTSDARQDGRRAAVSLRASHAEDADPEISVRAFAKWDEEIFQGGYFGARQAEGLLSAGGAIEGSGMAWSHRVSAASELGVERLSADAGSPGWMKAALMVMDELPLWDGLLVLAPSARVEAVGRFVLFSPKLGVTAFLPAGFELRANAGQAHRAPSFLELYVIQGSLLPNNQLRPERALTADAALARRWERLSFSAGGFYSLYEDLISYEYYPPFLARPFNFATAEVYGAEAELDARPHPWVSADASYTLMFSRNLRDDVRYYLHELPYRPRHRLHARLAVGPQWLRGRVGVAYQSLQYMNRTQDPELAMPARTFVDAGLAVQLLRSPRLSASLDVENLFDVHAQDVDGYPLPGRAAYLRLSLELDSSGGGDARVRRSER